MEHFSTSFYLGVYDDAREQHDLQQIPDAIPRVDVLRNTASMAASGRQAVAAFLESTGFDVGDAKQYETELYEVSALPKDMMRALAMVAKQERWRRMGRAPSLAPIEQAFIDEVNAKYASLPPKPAWMAGWYSNP